MDFNELNKKLKEMEDKEKHNSLNFNVIKTDEEFKKNYKQHDKGTELLSLELFKKRFQIIPMGEDLREQKVIFDNETPDYVIKKNNTQIAYDVKTKKSPKYFGWVNEKALKSYQNFEKETGIKTYAFFIQVEDNKIINLGYSNIFDKIVSIEKAWDGNKVVVLEWKGGFPSEIN